MMQDKAAPADSPQGPEVVTNPIIISMFTHKGGVGKTTGTYNLAALLASQGARVMLVDADPQCNLSKSIIQAKIRAQGLPFSSDSLDSLIRKVARHFLRAEPRQWLDVDGYKLSHVTEVKASATIDAQFPNLPIHEFMIYRKKIEELENQSVGSDEEHESEWMIYGQSTDGTKSHHSFESFDKVVSEDRIQAISEGGELTFNEQKQLLLHAADIFQHLDYQTHESFLPLVRCSLVLTNERQKLIEGGVGSFINQFILSRQKDAWILEQCLPDGKLEQIDLEEDLQKLLKFLNGLGDVLPESISDRNRSNIQKMISQYLYVNFLEGFNQKILDEGIDQNTIPSRVKRTSLIELIPPEEKANEAQQGSLLLLPGNYGVLLDLGRSFSFGIEGLSTGDFFKRFRDNIYALNEYIRQVAELNAVDVVMMDLSPSASDFNSSMLMTSDYFLTTVNPDPYSDDAIESLRTILSKWHRDFSQLYQSRPKSFYRPIKRAPACLGYFLQKMKIKNKDLESETDRKIAHDIQTIFEEDIVPLLVKLNMYPEHGLAGYSPEGASLAPGKYTLDIPMFTKVERRVQHEGFPVVWSNQESCKPFTSAFKRVLIRTIIPAILHHPRCSIKLKNIFSKSVEQQQVRDDEAFLDKWPKKFIEFAGNLSFEARINIMKDPFYRFDLTDMKMALATIRYKFHATLTPKIKFEDGVNIYRENPAGVLILDPCTRDEFKQHLQESLDKVLAHWNPETKLTFVTVPIFLPEYLSDPKDKNTTHLASVNWICVRLELNEDKKTVQVLFDDPRGGRFDFHKKKALPGDNDKDKEKRHFFNGQDCQDLVRGIKEGTQHYFRQKMADRHLQICNPTIMYKHLDQLGYKTDDVSSGVVVLSNIKDYLKFQPNGSVKLYPNRAYDKTAVLYNVIQVMNASHISGYRFEPVGADRPLDEFADAQLYSINLTPKDDRNCFSGGGERIALIRDEIVKFLNRHPGFFKAMVESGKQKNKQHYLKFVGDYLQSMLNRLKIDYRDEKCLAFLASSGYHSSILISMLRFKGKIEPTLFEYGTHEFAKRITPAALNACYKAYMPETPGSTKKPKRNSGITKSRANHQFSDSCAASSAPGVSQRNLFFARFSHFQQTLDVLSIQGEMGRQFRRLRVSADGDCGYSSYGITREQAFDVLEEALDDPDERFYNCIKPVVHQEIITNEFFEYFQNTASVTNPLILAFQNYKLTQQKEALIIQADKNLDYLARSYCEYDLRDKYLAAGYCHPCILQALACVQKIHLVLWKKEGNHIVPLRAPEGYGYQDYHEINPESNETKHILFVNNNHYEYLEPIEAPGQSVGHQTVKRKADDQELHTGKNKMQRRTSPTYMDDTSDEEYHPEAGTPEYPMSSRKRKRPASRQSNQSLKRRTREFASPMTQGQLMSRVSAFSPILSKDMGTDERQKRIQLNRLEELVERRDSLNDQERRECEKLAGQFPDVEFRSPSHHSEGSDFDPNEMQL